MFSQKDPDGFYMETIHKEYASKDPVFFDLDDFTWTRELERNADKIIECLAPVLAEDFSGLRNNGQDRFQFPPKIWKGFMFYFHGFKVKKNLKDYPYLASELAKIPNLVLAAVSVLEPGSHLLPHNGNSNGVMRYHLGLNIPAPMPDCGFIIAGSEVSWEKGKSFMFCNMNVHSAHNKTNRRRHILLLDVVRPEFVSIKKKICIHTLASILTTTTADYLRNIFKVKTPKVEQDPSKGLKYLANKGYTQNEILTISQRIFRKIEDLMRPCYIVALTIVFAFKKMQ